MIEISVSIPGGFINKTQAQINAVANGAINATLIATKAKWEGIAQQKLHTTRGDYIRGLNADNSIEWENNLTGSLVLRGKWANMLETGFSPFDMKDGFMHSKYVKQRKDGTGWYLTIPYRHRTPGTTGVAVGGNRMPKDIYGQAKKLVGNQRLTGTEGAYPAQVSWKGYQHKNGIYEGMIKNTKQYGKTKQSTYTTFRRVSDRSDDNSWWHKGYQGLHAIDDVQSYAQSMFNTMISDMLKNL